MSGAPFVRFSRDKRGYEHVYLMHVSNGKGGGRPHVLYWYRTPPGVKVGREPFDPTVRAALEAQNPDLIFDWKRISETQPPVIPENEQWRERRRIERAAKQARGTDQHERSARKPNRPPEMKGDSDPESPSMATESAAGSTPEPVADQTVDVRPPMDTPIARPPDGRRRRRRRGGRGRSRGSSGELAPGSAVTAGPDRPEMPDMTIRVGESSPSEAAAPTTDHNKGSIRITGPEADLPDSTS